VALRVSIGFSYPYPPVHQWLAEQLSLLKRSGEAIGEIRHALELDPNFATAHFFLARAYEAKGMYDEAVREYTTGAAVNLVLPMA
jgi:tetratricopeptide (TPR) repeat protein